MMLESYKILNTEKWFRPLRHIYTLFVTLLAFVFFRSDNLTTAFRYIGRMFSLSGNSPENTSKFLLQLTPMYLIMLVLGCIFSVPVWQTVRRTASQKIISVGEVLSYIVSLVLLAVCILTLSSASYNPFIYFRF